MPAAPVPHLRSTAGRRAAAQDRLALLVDAQRAIATSTPDLEAVLALALEGACRLTGAGAAAIELLDTTDGATLVRRTTSGPEAPIASLRLHIATHVPGRCVRSSMALRCDNAEVDPRVDREACRRAGVQSLVVVPLGNGGLRGAPVAGVIEVSSSLPAAFDEGDAGVLELLGALIATALRDAGQFVAARSPVAEPAAATALLQESEERFRSAFEHAGIGMALVGLDGRWLRVNRATCRITGYSAEELAALTFQDITHPDDLDTDLAHAGELLAGEITSYEMEKRYLHKSGHAVPILLTGSLVRDASGHPLHFIAQIQDVSARKAAEAAQARLSAIVEMMPDIVAICEPDGRVDYLNASGRKLLGFGDVQPAGVITITDVQPQFGPRGTLAGAVEAMRHVGIWRGETTLRRGDGRELPVEEILLAYPPDGGEAAAITAIMHDISERKHTEATLRGLALSDELTGLYNRRGFLGLAEEELRQAQRDGWPILLFYFDVDAFKSINDVHGHAEGDRALRDVAALLREVFRESDVLGRFGGDEFTALCPHGSADTEMTIRDRLARRLAEFNATSKRPYQLSVSLGTTTSPAGVPRTLTELLTEADAGLLEEKRGRRGSEGQ